MSRKKPLKEQVEQQLSDMLESAEEPSEGRMKLLKLGITMLAVNAKLDEATYGTFFEDTNGTGTGSVQEQPREKPASRKRANGDGQAES